MTIGPDDAARWRARAEGLADSLREVWRRGASVGGVPPFDSTQEHEPQERMFDRRFRPWLTGATAPQQTMRIE